MAKKHFYTQKLLNLLYNFSDKEGIMFLENFLIGTNHRIIVKADIPDVPKEKKGKICNADEEILSDIDSEIVAKIEKISNENRTKSFVIDFEKWNKIYETVKNKKRPKAYTELSPDESVVLTEGLIVKTKDFNKIVNFMEKLNAKLIKYNDDNFSIKSDYFQIIGVNCYKWFLDRETGQLPTNYNSWA